MIIAYKLFIKDDTYANEIGVFKYAYWNEEKESVTIGIKGMDDILLPMPLDEANAFVGNLFATMKVNEYIKISGLCFSDTDDTEALGREKGSYKFSLEKFKSAVAEKRRFIPERYTV